MSIQLDYCVGDYNLNLDVWFMAKDVTGNMTGKTSDAIYCVYCVNHGCIDPSQIVHISKPHDDVSKLQCCCTNQHNHPRIKTLKCLICCYESFERPSLVDDDTCNTCKECGINIEYWEYYCGRCSVKLLKCSECGHDIQDGITSLSAIGCRLPLLLRRQMDLNSINIPSQANKNFPKSFTSNYPLHVKNLSLCTKEQMVAKSAQIIPPEYEKKSWWRKCLAIRPNMNMLFGFGLVSLAGTTAMAVYLYAKNKFKFQKI